MPKTAIAAVAIVIVGWTGPLFAEPLSFPYNIQITQFCRFLACTPFSTVFPLTLTFDSEGSGFEVGNRRVRRYGKPVFSTIPLERFGAPPVAPESFDLSQTEQVVDKNPDGTSTNSAHAQELRAFFVNDDPDTVFTDVWLTELLAQQTTLSEPRLSAETVGRLFGDPDTPKDLTNRFRHLYGSATERFNYLGFAPLAEQTARIPGNNVHLGWIGPDGRVVSAAPKAFMICAVPGLASPLRGRVWTLVCPVRKAVPL